MKNLKLILTVLLITVSMLVTAQTMTITNPVLTSPYQVASGTVVTFKWSASSTAPNAIFTTTTVPTVNQTLPPDASWTQLTNWTGPDANGDYSINITVNSDIWVFGGISGFIGWQYSNVLSVQTISSMTITASNSMICPTNGSVLFTAPTGTGYTYQWYSDTTAISGATSSTFSANMAGSYHCVVNDGTANVSNSISITNYVASFSGAYGSNQVTLTSDQTFTSYQWYERVGTGSAVAISGATTNQYVATPTITAKHYSLEGTTTSGCAVSSVERMIIDTLFNTPVIVLNTSFNSQGNICIGTPTSIVSTGGNGFHQWMKNGSPSLSSTDSINLYGTYQNGTWNVDVSPTGWSEIAISSNSVTVNFIQLILPSITGANYYSNFCAGDIVPMILTDEGYAYTWYVHDTMNVYNSSHVISVPTGVYQHVFTNTQFVTIEGVFNGCTTTKTITLNSWSEKNLYLSIDNYDQQYLCTDSTVNVLVPSWSVADYQSFQWYENVGGSWTILTNDTLSALNVATPGEYRVEAVPVACQTAVVTSNPKVIQSYLDREPYIYSNQANMCEGDTVVLTLSAGGSWNAKQWLESSIVIGSSMYERTYIGMLNNSAVDTQEVFEYSSYRVSAKHSSCPNGLKVKSNIVFITPTLNPKIVLVTPFPSEPKHIIDWDSTEHVLGCQGEPVSMTIDDLSFSSITWYVQGYAGDDDYALGSSFSTLDTVNNTMDAKWITAVVTDANGCTGQSTPLLLDSRVFNSPAVSSYNNSELCNPGDSTLMHLAFQGTWISYEWELDGVIIPGATNDSIWGKDTGMYVINAYPADCPTFKYTSGLGPVVKYLYADILENESLIYAMPELGFYTYQWFFNGDSIDSYDPLFPEWVLPKDSLQVGTYTVAVSNENCTKLSDGYVWDINGVKDIIRDDLVSVFPNPTTGIVTIESENAHNISAITLSDTKGEVIFRTSGLNSNTLDLSNLTSGIYFLRIESKDGYMQFVKIAKQ